jgi:hypothetical protein
MADVYVSVTGFRPKAGIRFLRFCWHTLRSLEQARRASGNIKVSGRVINGTYHTMTVWTDKASMLAFVRCGAHRLAMQNFRELGSGKTYGFLPKLAPNGGRLMSYGCKMRRKSEPEVVCR